ncbi:hypothetical protein EG68_03404 [Paragonimus skrjabini miyazakii]|uniref:Uncharacterized protein n=1 Tax=Paragonimus skrjabini miyazakii TaxID=59628 RepID=A0A8S9Z7D7_9TREM|nr:hypothetical protein EG68_03404 [Paragonimus skrjabini miyazakii]
MVGNDAIIWLFLSSVYMDRRKKRVPVPLYHLESSERGVHAEQYTEPDEIKLPADHRDVYLSAGHTMMVRTPSVYCGAENVQSIWQSMRTKMMITMYPKRFKYRFFIHSSMCLFSKLFMVKVVRKEQLLV